MNLPQRLIVVDDDRTSNMICEFVFRRFSPTTEIKTFVDPDDALQFIKDSYVDAEFNIPTILFLDINMPVFTGWDFLDIFNDFSEHIRQQFVIYILTSSIEQKDLEKAEANPLVMGLLSKPLSASIIKGIFNPD